MREGIRASFDSLDVGFMGRYCFRGLWSLRMKGYEGWWARDEALREGMWQRGACVLNEGIKKRPGGRLVMRVLNVYSVLSGSSGCLAIRLRRLTPMNDSMVTSAMPAQMRPRQMACAVRKVSLTKKTPKSNSMLGLI